MKSRFLVTERDVTVHHTASTVIQKTNKNKTNTVDTVIEKKRVLLTTANNSN